ncbi:MAG TPA: hypothetical protein VF022_03745 [Rhodanobacteraceae bacterium]
MKTRILRRSFLAAGLLLACAVAAPAAFARSHVSIGLGFYGPGYSVGYNNCVNCYYGRAYYPPAYYSGYYYPSYYAAPAYYYNPAPVYYDAYPAYGTVYYGGYYGGGYYHHRDRDDRRWRHRDDHRWRDRDRDDGWHH